MKDKKSKTKITEDHIAQVMDRSWLLCLNVDQFLLEHSAVPVDREFEKLASKAHQALFDLYQLAGAKLCDGTFETGEKKKKKGKKKK